MSEPRTLTQGTTAEGARVVVVHSGGHYADDMVFVNGREMTVQGASRLRDGGTTTYRTDGGTLTLPRRRDSSDRTPRWRPSQENNDG